MTAPQYDALLILSFGGPEQREEVIPFLENVLRGRNVPRERMLEVAEHYYLFGGRSPINQNNRDLIAALQVELNTHGPALPIYWGNRNWHPLLADTLRQMRADGVRRVLAFVTSAFGSYSGCRQYLEDIDRARAEVGPDAPEIHKLRTFHNHPGFIEAVADRLRAAMESLPPERVAVARLIFTAHSIPLAMAQSSPYVAQLNEAADLVARYIPWTLAYQSRSGPPSQPWLEPDIADVIRACHNEGVSDIIVSPIGFLSDHMEVVYDLDTEAAALSRELGITLHRAGAAGVHPAFVSMIRELILERTEGLRNDACAPECCARTQRTPSVGAICGRPA